MTNRILRRAQVQAITGLSRTHIYEFSKAGSFPAPVKIGPRAVGWSEREVQEWIDAKLSGREWVKR